MRLPIRDGAGAERGRPVALRFAKRGGSFRCKAQTRVAQRERLQRLLGADRTRVFFSSAKMSSRPGLQGAHTHRGLSDMRLPW